MADDRVCPWWLAYTFDNPFRHLFQNPAKIVGPYLGPGQAALDLGCGMGFFSRGMARLVGPEGRVIALDLQQEMLDTNLRRAKRVGLADRIEPRLCRADDLGPAQPVDFALAMWMVHETPDQAAFLAQAAAWLKPEGRFLIAEPKMHVTRADLDRTVQLFPQAGLKELGRPKVGLSRTVLCGRAEPGVG